MFDVKLFCVKVFGVKDAWCKRCLFDVKTTGFQAFGAFAGLVFPIRPYWKFKDI